MDPENNQGMSPAYTQQKSNPLVIPLAIIIGAGLIAAALFLGGTTSSSPTHNAQMPTTDAPQEASTNGSIRPVDGDDHIRGNPNAPIVIVEYSDYDCPFCKSYHQTMNQIMDEYGASGQVAWVYRQFPLVQLHPNAPTIALASECVADLGGNDAFWSFSDLVFEERERNTLTNITKLSSYAAQAGVDETEFNTCLSEERFADKVAEDSADALTAGAKGTPYSLVLIGGQQGVINGAQPYDAVKQIIETLLTQIQG